MLSPHRQLVGSVAAYIANRAQAASEKNFPDELRVAGEGYQAISAVCDGDNEPMIKWLRELSEKDPADPEAKRLLALFEEAI